jgi:hypothetical protein
MAVSPPIFCLLAVNTALEFLSICGSNFYEISLASFLHRLENLSSYNRGALEATSGVGTRRRVSDATGQSSSPATRLNVLCDLT